MEATGLGLTGSASASPRSIGIKFPLFSVFGVEGGSQDPWFQSLNSNPLAETKLVSLCKTNKLSVLLRSMTAGKLQARHSCPSAQTSPKLTPIPGTVSVIEELSPANPNHPTVSRAQSAQKDERQH